MNQRLRELIRLFFNLIQNIEVFFLRLLGIIDFPVPPNSNMRRTSAKTIKHYIYSGITTYLPIATLAQYLGVNFDEKIKILDFGCGGAGQLRMFTKHFPTTHFYACDVDPSSIDFIKRGYPQVNSCVNNFKPPLPFESNQFDLIYSVSTFSHFDAETINVWLLEFSRILKVNGVLLLTIEGEFAIKVVADETTESPELIKLELEKSGIFYKNYDWLGTLQKRGKALTKSVDISTYFGSAYGNTVLSRKFIDENFNNYGLKVMGVSEGIICERQDLVALIKLA
jgi:SAM-dependent methyltransferase